MQRGLGEIDRDQVQYIQKGETRTIQKPYSGYRGIHTPATGRLDWTVCDDCLCKLVSEVKGPKIQRVAGKAEGAFSKEPKERERELGGGGKTLTPTT